MPHHVLFPNKLSASETKAIAAALRLVESTLQQKSYTLTNTEREKYTLDAAEKVVLQQLSASFLAGEKSFDMVDVLHELSISQVLETYITRFHVIIEKLQDAKLVVEKNIAQRATNHLAKKSASPMFVQHHNVGLGDVLKDTFL